jgi:hypothetical protein
MKNKRAEQIAQKKAHKAELKNAKHRRAAPVVVQERPNVLSQGQKVSAKKATLTIHGLFLTKTTSRQTTLTMPYTWQKMLALGWPTLTKHSNIG